MKVNEIEVFGRRVLVQKEDMYTNLEKKGIWLSDKLKQDAKEKQIKGTVLKVGAECSMVKEGDMVVWELYAGGEMAFDEGTYHMILEDDILWAGPIKKTAS